MVSLLQVPMAMVVMLGIPGRLDKVAVDARPRTPLGGKVYSLVRYLEEEERVLMMRHQSLLLLLQVLRG